MRAPLTALALAFAATLHAHPGAHVAIDYFSARILENPRDQALHIQRGIAYSEDGDYAAALADFERAQELGDPAAVSFDLGVLYYRMRDFDRARMHLDLCLARDPRRAAALEYRARVRRDAGDAAGAVADYRAFFAVSAQPNPGDYAAAAALLAGIEGQGPAAALALLDEGIARLGELPALQREAIALERARGRDDLALARQRRLERPLGASPEWCVGMAELLLANGERAEARAYAERAGRELAQARPTPARIALQQRLEAVRTAAAE